jgi:alanine racemase
VPPEDAVKVAKLVAESPWVSLEGMFTHLATADVADTQFAQQQVSAFSRSVEQVRASGMHTPIHLAPRIN